jgi:hypothetical protein
VDDPLPVVSDLPVDPPNSSTLDPLPGVAALPGSVEDELPAAGIDDEPPLAPTEGVVVLAPPVVAVEPPAEGMVDELSVVGIEDEPPVAPTDGFVVVAPPVVVVEPLFEVLVLVCANATLDRAAAKVAARRAFFIIHSSLLPRVDLMRKVSSDNPETVISEFGLVVTGRGHARAFVALMRRVIFDCADSRRVTLVQS